MAETKPVPPNNLSMQVTTWLRNIQRAMDDGDTNPHIVLRDIIGEVYAQGFHGGYSSALSDRPLTTGAPA